MATIAGLITIAEYEKIPNPDGGHYQLQDGELIFVPYPRPLHRQIQMAIFIALHRLIGGFGFGCVELGFRPTPEYNEWAADVAFVARERWQATDKQKTMVGAPDLIIEVMSASNTVLDMNRREAVCLANGSRQFWLVDPEMQIVRVSISGDNKVLTYRAGDDIDLADFGGGKLSVAEIFAE